jgi:hypothetical protein
VSWSSDGTLNTTLNSALPQTAVAVYWGRILPLLRGHRQPATEKQSAFRNEELAFAREGVQPNRYPSGDWWFTVGLTEGSKPVAIYCILFCNAEKIELLGLLGGAAF